MSGLPISLQLDDQALEAVAQRVAAILADTAADDPWLSVEEAAARARCGKQRIYDLLSQGRLRGGRDGSRRLIQQSELDAYLGGPS